MKDKGNMINMFGFFRNKESEYYRYLIKEDKKMLYGFNSKYINQEEKLLELYGSCDKFDKEIAMIVLADTHGDLKEEEFARFVCENNNYDLCLLLGNHSIGDIKIILKYIEKEKIYALLGNHDIDYISQFELNNLNGQIVEIKDVRLMGIRGSYRYKNEDFPSFSQKESIEFLDGKEKVDILVSHDGPFGINGSDDIAHQGLFGIMYYLYKNKVPYCIHGHLHTQYSKQLLNGTKVECKYMYNSIKIGGVV